MYSNSDDKPTNSESYEDFLGDTKSIKINELEDWMDTKHHEDEVVSRPSNDPTLEKRRLARLVNNSILKEKGVPLVDDNKLKEIDELFSIQ